MHKIRFRLRVKMYPALWTIITALSVYLLVRFALISFSEDMGQATFGEALLLKLCGTALETGSSFISFTKEGGASDYSFLLSILDDGLVLGKFQKEDPAFTLDSTKYSSFLDFPTSMTSTKEYDTSQNDLNDEIVSRKVSYQEMKIYQIESDSLGLEYILTNGGVLRSDNTGVLLGDKGYLTEQLPVGYLLGEISKKEAVDEDNSVNSDAVEAAAAAPKVEYTMEQLKDVNFLIKNFYIVDDTTKISEKLFDAEKLLKKDMTLKQGSDKPQILICHTHAHEAYADSKPEEASDTVVGVGEYLKEILEEDYGYQVIHDTTAYEYNYAYSQGLEHLTKVLDENPSIEVIIDLHRNSGEAKTVLVNGKETAQIMLFNGLSRDQNGPIAYLDNPYLKDNLAFSLQLQLKSMDRYPGLFNRNYLKCYRYNMHLRAKCLLMELGTVKNSLQSAKNAMVPFAEILDEVLKGE